MSAPALLIIAALYFLPTLVAGIRSCRRGPGIFVLNLLLGWTVIGWIVALVWSFSASSTADEDRLVKKIRREMQGEK